MRRTNEYNYTYWKSKAENLKKVNKDLHNQITILKKKLRKHGVNPNKYLCLY